MLINTILINFKFHPAWTLDIGLYIYSPILKQAVKQIENGETSLSPCFQISFRSIFLITEHLTPILWLCEVETAVYSKLASLFTLYMAIKQWKPPTLQLPPCDFFRQFHSSVQLVTLALGWLRLIVGQYVFALRGLPVELEQPDGIAFACALVIFIKNVW